AQRLLAEIVVERRRGRRRVHCTPLSPVGHASSVLDTIKWDFILAPWCGIVPQRRPRPQGRRKEDGVKTTHYRRTWLWIAALAALLIASAAAAARPTRTAALPVLRIGITGISDPNPAKYPGGATAASAWSLAYEPLIIEKANGSYVPGVASPWR